MWEKRFSTPDYLFGKAPAEFLRNHQSYLLNGHSALSVADGEGRNSVFMATQGMSVTALEYAPSAIAKAHKLAAEHKVSVAFTAADVLAYDWPDAAYDLTVAIFIQFVGPDGRKQIFDGMKHATKPGGLIMVHGYTPQQIEFGTGGPGKVENLYTDTMLADDFSGWEILENRAYIRAIQEGPGHSGQSALIDFIARKPARIQA